MAPTETPSPHRFLTPRSNPPSSHLRFLHNPPHAPSSQFAPTPKFKASPAHFAPDRHDSLGTQVSSPLTRPPILLGSATAKNHEEIEEPSSSLESDKEPIHGGLSDYIVPESKRRRTNPVETIAISSSPEAEPTSPNTPPLPTTELLNDDDNVEHDVIPGPTNLQTLPTTQARLRFRLPPPVPDERDKLPIVPPRPPLILPPRSPTPEPPEPSAFYSPHRRDQKYIPGGLAATVRDWVVETAQMGRHAKASGSRENKKWDVSIRVEECREGSDGVGMIMVRDEEGKRWILLGRGRTQMDVELGRVVGVREPIWDVLVAEVKWRVAIEWAVE